MSFQKFLSATLVAMLVLFSVIPAGLAEEGQKAKVVSLEGIKFMDILADPVNPRREINPVTECVVYTGRDELTPVTVGTAHGTAGPLPVRPGTPVVVDKETGECKYLAACGNDCKDKWKPRGFLQCFKPEQTVVAGEIPSMDVSGEITFDFKGPLKVDVDGTVRHIHEGTIITKAEMPPERPLPTLEPPRTEKKVVKKGMSTWGVVAIVGILGGGAAAVALALGRKGGSSSSPAGSVCCPAH